MAACTLVFSELEAGIFARTTAVCLGTGRFLRAVLVPALVHAGEEVVLAQTRGTSFGKHVAQQSPSRSYEVDTVRSDGTVDTQKTPIAAVGSLGVDAGRKAFLALAGKLPMLRYVGVGITEAGVVHNGQSIQDLAEFLHACFQSGIHSHTPLSIINTDNVPWNGTCIANYVQTCDFVRGLADERDFLAWLRQQVVFHNSMVDRITSCRDGVPEVPRAEPLPKKALVIEDLTRILPEAFRHAPGVVVRTSAGELALDLALKLRIANGTHTSMVYPMALSGLLRTDACIDHPHILPYLEHLFRRDLLHSADDLGAPAELFHEVFEEWAGRLQHAHFGLETFFISQNASQKLAMRVLPSAKATVHGVENGTPRMPSPFMTFAFASALRFITPLGEQPRLGESPPVFAGLMDDDPNSDCSGKDEQEYVTGLHVNAAKGQYEFRDGDGQVPSLLREIGKDKSTPEEIEEGVWKVMKFIASLDPSGDSACEALLQNPQYRLFSNTVAAMWNEMISGRPAMLVLRKLCEQHQ
mmetsp:Transcript_43577/g.100404  ORF Transcript_43577/g.100404 Transcript_43577/m.100404 type:complete len:525 (-) Transcript_43577:92-1666(-)